MRVAQTQLLVCTNDIKICALVNQIVMIIICLTGYENWAKRWMNGS